MRGISDLLQAGGRYSPPRLAAVPIVSVLMLPDPDTPSAVLAHAIARVFNQGLREVELILIADGSEPVRDVEFQLARDADERVGVLAFPRPADWPALRLHRALTEARGEFISLQCGGAVLLPGALSRLVAAARDSGAGLTYGPTHMHDQTEAKEAGLVWVAEAPLALNALPDRQNIATAGALMPRAAIAECGGLDTHLSIRWDYDLDLMRRLTAMAGSRHVPEPAAECRHPASARRRQAPGNRRLVTLRMGLPRSGSAELGSEVQEPWPFGASGHLRDDPFGDEFLARAEDRHAFRDQVLWPWLASHLTAEEMRITAAESLLPPRSITLGIYGRIRSTASAVITHGHFAQLFPRTIRLYAPQQYGEPIEMGEAVDVVVHFRANDDVRTGLSAAVRRLGRPTIYCMDDDLLNLVVGPSGSDSYAPDGVYGRNVRAHLADADLAMVYSPHTVSEVRPYNPRVVLGSTNIPAGLVTDVPRSRLTAGRTTYAIIGNYLRAEELSSLRDELLAFFAENTERVELVLFGHEGDASAFAEILPGVSFALREKSNYAYYLRRLRVEGFDFVLNPLQDHERFFNGKSPIKYLEATAAGAVLITSDVPAYAGITHGNTGIKVAWAPGAWAAALRASLQMQAAERSAMVARAQAHVTRTYSTEIWLPAFYAQHLVARLHADFLARQEAGGMARILVAVGKGPENAGLTAILRSLGFEVAMPEELGQPNAVLDPEAGARVLQQTRIALVHGASAACPWIAAARRAGIPCVAGEDAAAVHRPPSLRTMEEEPDVLLAASPGAAQRARTAGFANVATVGDPIEQVESTIMAGPITRVGLMARGAAREVAAALAAKALSKVCAAGKKGASPCLALPFDEEELQAWSAAWPRWAEQCRLTAEPALGGDNPQAASNDIGILLVAGAEQGLGRAVLRLMHRGCLIIGMPGTALDDIVEHGRNGWLLQCGGASALGALLAQVLAAPPIRLDGWRAQARSAAGVWGMPDLVAARLVGAYCDATDALRRRIRRAGAGKPTLASFSPPSPEHRFTLSVRPGGRLLLLGFRSANGQWGEVIEASWEHGWRVVTPPGAEPAMEAYGAQGASARFVVRAHQLEIGFRALQGSARVDVANDTERRTIDVQAETWFAVGTDGA